MQKEHSFFLTLPYVYVTPDNFPYNFHTYPFLFENGYFYLLLNKNIRFQTETDTCGLSKTIRVDANFF